MGKTETIKQRAVAVYLPTEEMLESWKSAADKYGLPLSRFIVATVDESIRKGQTGTTLREELEKELTETKEQLKALREKAESMEEALRRADVTVAEYRSKLAEPVLSNAEAEFTSRLIEMFVEERVLNVDEVPEKFGIDLTDTKAVGRLRTSVDVLKKAGLVETGICEWRWKGRGKRKPRISPERRRELGRTH